jgi:hypothetical protein
VQLAAADGHPQLGALYLGVVAGWRSLPGLVVSTVAGAIADRNDRAGSYHLVSEDQPKEDRRLAIDEGVEVDAPEIAGIEIKIIELLLVPVDSRESYWRARPICTSAPTLPDLEVVPGTALTISSFAGLLIRQLGGHPKRPTTNYLSAQPTARIVTTRRPNAENSEINALRAADVG